VRLELKKLDKRFATALRFGELEFSFEVLVIVRISSSAFSRCFQVARRRRRSPPIRTRHRPISSKREAVPSGKPGFGAQFPVVAAVAGRGIGPNVVISKSENASISKEDQRPPALMHGPVPVISKSPPSRFL